MFLFDFLLIHNTLQSTKFTPQYCQFVKFCICAEFLDKILSEKSNSRVPSKICNYSPHTDVVLFFFLFFSKTSASSRARSARKNSPTTTPFCWRSINPLRFSFIIRARRTSKRKYRVCEQANVIMVNFSPHFNFVYKLRNLVEISEHVHVNIVYPVMNIS